MAQVAAGDRDAFDILAARHVRRALGLAQRLIGSLSDAEDVAQDAFLRVWRRRHRWRAGRAKFSTWFHRIVVNLCIDRRRRRPLLPADHFEALADPTPDALERLERDEWARTVAEAVRDLTPRQHAALVLCYYEGLSHTEAGEILSISAIAIESLVARARRKLRDKLQSLARPHA